MTQPHDGYGPSKADEITCDARPRCVNCNELLAEFVSRPWAIKCRRCRLWNRRGAFAEWFLKRIADDQERNPVKTIVKNNTPARRRSTVQGTTDRAH